MTVRRLGEQSPSGAYVLKSKQLNTSKSRLWVEGSSLRENYDKALFKKRHKIENSFGRS
jgi:hypothetical protein